jgi:hypothetical protein
MGLVLAPWFHVRFLRLARHRPWTSQVISASSLLGDRAADFLGLLADGANFVRQLTDLLAGVLELLAGLPHLLDQPVQAASGAWHRYAENAPWLSGETGAENYASD